MSDMKTLTVASLWKRVSQFYVDIMAGADPRVVNWPLISNIGYPMGFILAYFFIIFYVAPKVLNKFPNLNISKAVSIYNTAMIFANIIMAYLFSWYAYLANYSFLCQAVKHSGSEIENKIAQVFWYYYLSKIAELCDTIFLKLRNRNAKILGIFLYHHASMVLISWIGVKFIPGGTTLLFAWINTSVHIILYVYYKLNDLGYKRDANLAIFTAFIQIVQFMLIIILSFVTIFIDCNFPRMACWTLILYMFSFILFVIPAFLQQYYFK